MGYYDDAQHAGDTGHALFDLAISDHSPTEARARLTAAVDGHTAEFTRSKAISSIKLASLTMATGEPAEATAIGIAALDTAGTIRSCRAADDLRQLSGFAARHHATSGTSELRHRIAALTTVS
ncbi:hypothetical protein [Actinokineospora spheciospongiae]|uniref:hypothetical protein n=1 Tax=Actinokineospora spheciospongiae TaxID=909613 RepID=UPI0004AF812F|nr:hypothetical protein [Actinokineospora spheciospongiae]